MKVRFYLLLIIVFSLLPIASFFVTNLLPHTHDGLVHLPRMGAFYKALVDGQFPVRWAGDLNYGYGMPLFNFIYQLPYFIASFFIYLGLGLVNAFKITLVLSYVLSGIFMFLFAKELTNDNKSGFLVAVLYQFFPFRLVELTIRGSFGEVYTYTFLPLVLYGVLKILKGSSTYSIVLTALATALLVLSHNSVSLLFFGLIVGFVLFFGKNKKSIILALAALGLGLLLSMYYWFPALLDHKYTYGNLHMRNLYKEHFAPFYQFILPNITNSPSLQTGGIAVSLGVFHVLAILCSAWLLFKKKINHQERKMYIFSVLILVIAFFFMQPISQIIWEKVSLLRQFQFPWRFLAICGFATSLLGLSMMPILKKKNHLYWIVIVGIIVSTFYYWKPALGYDKVQEKDYWNFPLNTTYYGETDIIWTAGPAKQFPKNRVEFAAGKGEIKDFKKLSNKHTFTVNASVNSTVVDHTQYFPGWTAYVDGKKVPIEFQDQNWRGYITFPVPQGNHSVVLQFEETKVRKLANIISFSSLIVLLVIAGIRKKII